MASICGKRPVKPQMAEPVIVEVVEHLYRQEEVIRLARFLLKTRTKGIVIRDPELLTLANQYALARVLSADATGRVTLAVRDPVALREPLRARLR